jgi:hypothetical protein
MGMKAYIWFIVWPHQCLENTAGTIDLGEIIGLKWPSALDVIISPIR